MPDKPAARILSGSQPPSPDPSPAARILGRKGDSSPAPQPTRVVLLWIDNQALLAIHSRVTTQALVNDKPVDRFRKHILGQGIKSADLSMDGLIGMDEFSVKPAAKWTVPLELGAEFEMKWNLRGEKAIDNTLATVLSAIHPVLVDELSERFENQTSDTPLEQVLYPGQPLVVTGAFRTLADEEVPEKRFSLHGLCKKVDIAVDDIDGFAQMRKALANRALQVCGSVERLDGSPSIRAAAVLLCE